MGLFDHRGGVSELQRSWVTAADYGADLPPAPPRLVHGILDLPFQPASDLICLRHVSRIEDSSVILPWHVSTECANHPWYLPGG